ncbi:S-layer protein, partial [Candidatus Woesearchaeota archaeon]|nr:S-layer protein [Candidatus Woesearchaeota archaeon]
DDNDFDDITMKIPAQQVRPGVYLTVGETEILGSVISGELGELTTQPIKVNPAKLDSEVSGGLTGPGTNMILVGGPCANDLAKEFMGNPANCAEGFEEGKGIAKVMDLSNGKVALLVAGYSAEDTRAAAKVLANYKDYPLSGTEVEVTSVDMSTSNIG